MRSVSALIFDFDGTLIDSSDGVVEAVNYSLRQLGQPEQPAEVIKRYIGFPLSQMYPDFTSAPLSELYRHFQVKAVDSVVEATTPLEGADALVAKLKEQGYRMAIATTKRKQHVDAILDRLNWRGFFGAAVGGDEVSRVKPDPEALAIAIKRLGAHASESLMIGDTVNDVLAARAMGMRVAAVSSPYGRRDELVKSGPDFFLEEICELQQLLERLNNASRGVI